VIDDSTVATSKAPAVLGSHSSLRSSVARDARSLWSLRRWGSSSTAAPLSPIPTAPQPHLTPPQPRRWRRRRQRLPRTVGERPLRAAHRGAPPHSRL